MARALLLPSIHFFIQPPNCLVSPTSSAVQCSKRKGRGFANSSKYKLICLWRHPNFAGWVVKQDPTLKKFKMRSTQYSLEGARTQLRTLHGHWHLINTNIFLDLWPVYLQISMSQKNGEKSNKSKWKKAFPIEQHVLWAQILFFAFLAWYKHLWRATRLLLWSLTSDMYYRGDKNYLGHLYVP